MVTNYETDTYTSRILEGGEVGSKVRRDTKADTKYGIVTVAALEDHRITSASVLVHVFV